MLAHDDRPERFLRCGTPQGAILRLAAALEVSAAELAEGREEAQIAALREAGVGERIACLVHELTPESRQALLERCISGVFQTPLKELCADLMATVVHTIEQGMAENPGQRFVAPYLLTPESI